MLWNSFNVTCYISKQFSSHCFFFIGKNKRETYMTLIRQMHSLGRGEGRAGGLSDNKYMHWLQDKMASAANGDESCAHGQSSFWDHLGQVWRVGFEVPLMLSLHYHASCVLHVSYGGLPPRNRKKGKRSTEREREREKDHHHHHCGQRYFQTWM